MISLFSKGFRGLADTAFSGVVGSAFRAVGIDFRSEPGKIKVHQKLTKASGAIVTTLCKSGVLLSNGLRVWFGGSKAYLDNAGTFTLKQNLSQFSSRDAMFSSPTFGFTGDPSSVVRMSDDGMSLFASSHAYGVIRQYALKKPYDLTDKTLVAKWTAPTINGSSIFYSFWIEEDRLFILGTDHVKLFKISGWNISNVKFFAQVDIDSKTLYARDIAVDDTLTNMYVMDVNGEIYKYVLNGWGGIIPTFRQLVVGGGGGGAGVRALATVGRLRGGCGGSGNATEFTDEAMTPGTTYTVVVGAAGTGGAAGTNNGTDGGDTTAFGKVAKGGGYGSAVNSEGSGVRPENAGGQGGSGGGAGLYTDQGSAIGGIVESGSSRYAGGTAGGDSGDGTGGGIGLVSDISGSSVTYSPSTPRLGAAGNGANATLIGGGGQAGYGGASIDRSGGNGLAGKAVIRFKTSEVSYSQSGGTVTTSGSDTIITWSTSGNFSYTMTGPAYSATYNFPTARGFAIESGRLAFIVGDKITQYTITGFDLSTATLHPNALFIPTASETVTPRSLFFSSGYLVVGMETGSAEDMLSVIFFEFIGGGTDILSGVAFSPSILEVEKSQAFFDSTGLTELLGNTQVGYQVAGSTSYNFPVREQMDLYKQNTAITGPGFARAYLQADVSQTIWGYPTVSSSSNVAITTVDYPAVAPGTLSFDSVVSDSFIMNDALGTAGSEARSTVIQPYVTARDVLIDAVEIKYREGFGMTPTPYSLVLEIRDQANNLVATQTLSILPGDIGTSETMIRFTFGAITLAAGDKYTVQTYVSSVGSLGWNRASNRYLVCPLRSRGVNPFSATNNLAADVEIQMRLIDTSITASEEEAVPEERVYFTTEKMLFYIKASDVSGSWDGKIVTVGAFAKGNDTYHPMAVQNLSLFIGDSSVIAQVLESGTFVQETNLNTESDETITALKPFDVDLLIGTKWRNIGRVLRWDTESESWSAQDEVFDKGGVTAFLPDDNYVYVFAGEKGVMYFYNGEKNELSQRIPGVLLGKARVEHNAVGFINNIPVFGLSNVDGNTVLQGVYGLGKYSPGYTVSLSLDYPIPTNAFSGVSIGAILVDGQDMYVAYQDATEIGVAKLDYTAKYATAYIETVMLSGGELRPQLKTLVDVHVPYCELPVSTGITLGLKKIYEVAYKDMTVTTDPLRLAIRMKTPNTANVANPQLRIGFTVSANTAPVIEDVLYNLASPIPGK